MDTKAHYTLIGLAVVILLASLVTGILWLSVGLDRPVYHIYQVYMNQNISGLNQEASVKFNGVDVGYVRSMTLNPKNPQEVIINLDIKQGTPITTSTSATLAPQGITGLSYISLSAKTPNAPLLQPRNKAPYPIIPSSPSLFVQLNSLFKDASTQFQAVSTSVQNVLDAQNAANMKQILINLNTISGNLAADSNTINKILQQTATASANFPNITKNIDESMVNLNQTSNLAKQAMLPTMHLLEQLNSISSNIESFSNDLAQNPTILIRGKSTNTVLGPGE